MKELLFSPGFWFGAAVVGFYQITKFGELSSVDPAVAARRALIPNARASDFAGKVPYWGAFAAFVAATFVIYLVLCSVAPTILQGWAKISGADPGADLTNFVGSVHYPLYIAAALIGFTQPGTGIPFLSNIGNVQRNLFHAWMGVPRRVMNASSFYSNQILTRSPTRRHLAVELQVLISDAWVKRIDTYADADFYRDQLARLKLDDDAEVREILKGSRPELRKLTQQLVDVASLATVRESGFASLDRLADDLGVSSPSDPGGAKAVLSSALLILIGMAILWNLIPLFDSPMARLFGTGPENDFWPTGLKFSGQDLIRQAAPIFLVTCIAFPTWMGAFRRAQVAPLPEIRSFSGLVTPFSRHSGLFGSVLTAVLLFDLCQTFFDYGLYKPEATGSLWTFVPTHLPFYLLHSFVSLAMCAVVLVYMYDATGHIGTRSILASLAAAVALTSLFYAAARVQYQYGLSFGPNGVDMAVLVVVINVTAALLAFASAAICKHQSETPPSGPQPPAQQDQTQSLLTTISDVQAGDALGSAAPAGG